MLKEGISMMYASETEYVREYIDRTKWNYNFIKGCLTHLK